jgi:hypothetical protein
VLEATPDQLWRQKKNNEKSTAAVAFSGFYYQPVLALQRRTCSLPIQKITATEGQIFM